MWERIIKCVLETSVQDWSAVISIGTPIILLIWFFHSQKQILSKSYYDEVKGVYAGFVESTFFPKYNGIIYSGIIMELTDINGQGYFKGEARFGARESCFKDGMPTQDLIHTGIYFFHGKLIHRIKLKRNRNPFVANKNRKYIAKFYFVEQLEATTDIDNYEKLISAEYKIEHFREMQVLKFSHVKSNNKAHELIPKSFTLYRSGGYSMEPFVFLKDYLIE